MSWKPNSPAPTRKGLTRFSHGSHKEGVDDLAMGTETPSVLKNPLLNNTGLSQRKNHEEEPT